MKISAEYKDGTLELSKIIEEGGWVIRVSYGGTVRLYEVPQYGGAERFVDNFTNVIDAIREGESWT